MKKLLPIIAVFFVLGCTMSIENIFKMIPMVQDFLNQHPGAGITITYWTSEEVNSTINEINEMCNKSLPIQPMYLARVAEGSLEIVAWFDTKYQLLCAVKPPVEIIEEKSEEPEKIEQEQAGHVSTGTTINLEGKQVDNKILLKWTIYGGEDFKYYKIVRSRTNPSPKYPEDGYVGVVSKRLKNYYYDSPEKGNNFYTISVVKTDGSIIHSNSIVIRYEKGQEKIQNFTLNYSFNNKTLVLKWDELENIRYYKVVRSQTNKDPKYPEDGYISVEYGTEFEEIPPNGTSYYRITAVMKDGEKIHSNVITIER